MEGLSTLAKRLASDQLKVRRSAQIEVGNILSQVFEDEDSLPSYMEILALCKGLHYSLWMQDKLLLKEEVVTRICGVLPRIENRTILMYYANAMFETLAREWDRLDNWRVDKFMLLTRDFFNTGLQIIPEMGEETWNDFLAGIFEKVLNKDVQHAIGLKMHFCTILTEELSKKKVKAFCVVSTLMHLINRLKDVPRHHSYAHTLLRLIFSLIRCLRKHANPSLDAVINSAVKYTAQRGGHRKSFRRIATTLSNIRDSKQKKREVTKTDVPKAKTKRAKKSPTLSPMETDGGLTIDSSPQTGKRKKVKPPALTNSKKRRISEESPLGKLNEMTLRPFAIEKDEASQTKATLIQDEEKPNLENIHVLPVSPSVSLPQSEVNGVCDRTTEDVAVYSGVNPSTAGLNTPNSGQRRVSFGKVFRKKFKSTQRLSMTPTVKTTPSKGILRGNH